MKDTAILIANGKIEITQVGRNWKAPADWNGTITGPILNAVADAFGDTSADDGPEVTIARREGF